MSDKTFNNASSQGSSLYLVLSVGFGLLEHLLDLLHLGLSLVRGQILDLAEILVRAFVNFLKDRLVLDILFGKE